MRPESPRSSPARRALAPLVASTCAALILAGCGDPGTAPLTPDAPLPSAAGATGPGQGASAPPIPLWGPPGLVTPYACDTRVAERSRTGVYRESTIYLHFPPGLVARAGGETRRYRYRRYRPDGYLTREALCDIPGSFEAYEMANRRFGLHDDGGMVIASEGSLDECGLVGEPPCELEAIVCPTGQTMGLDGECYCDNPHHTLDEDGECRCDNGSGEWDCSLEEEPECDPLFQDCGCDPLFEICEGQGTGSGGGSDGPGGECDPEFEECGGFFEASLECDTGVIRAEVGGCTLIVSDESRLDEITGWLFDSAVGSIPSGHSGPRWEGQLVTSGTVTVFFRMTDGTDSDRQADLAVEPRSWSGSVKLVDLWGGQGSLPIEPEQPEHLGHALIGLDWETNWLTTADPGPNEGIAYLTDPPFFVDGLKHVNEAAFTVGSAFLNGQPGPPYCTSTEAAGLQPLVIAHEDEHVVIYYHEAAPRIAALEGEVASDKQTLVGIISPHRSEIEGHAQAKSEELDDPGIIFPCQIKWDY
jgi:hypothetical protein